MFNHELIALLNRYSKEQDSGTPDFLLAAYLARCLDNWNETTRERERWHGRDTNPVSPQPAAPGGAS